MRVPDCLRGFRAFTLWRTELGRTPEAKPIKVPVHHDGVTRHSTANPAQMLSADEAEGWLAHLRATRVGHDRPADPGYLGIGFRPSPANGMVVLDLDDQLDSPLLPLFEGGGMEVSISGKGLHIWGSSANAAAIGRRGQVSTDIGKMEVYADNQFIALGTWLGGDARLDLTASFDYLLETYFPKYRAPEQVTVADWDEKTEQQRADALADLRAAIRFYDPDNRDEWVSAGQALKCLGDLGKAIWVEWSATSKRFPGGADLEKWDTFTGERSDYRAIFAKAATRGWANPARGAKAEEVFAAHTDGTAVVTEAGAAALREGIERVRAEPTEEALREVAFNVARLGAGGQLDWQDARRSLLEAAPWADTAVLERAEVKAKLAPLTASALATIESEQVKVSAQVGWLRAEGVADAGAVLNERALAFRMLEAHPGQLRKMANSDGWIVWDGHRWQPKVHEQVRDMCMHEVPVMLAREMLNLAGVGGVDYMKMSVKAATVATSGSVASALAYLPGVLIQSEEVNADAFLCGMDSGRAVLDLRSGQMRKALFSDHITRSLGPTEIGESRLAVRWLQFLDEVFLGDRELLDWIHRFCGYMLTASTREQMLLFLFGHGSNGKSVFTGVIESLMGEYGRTLQPTSLCDDKRAAGGATADLASLDGMRLVTSAEAEEGSRFAESLLKGLVAGDKMPVRQLYGRPYDMQPVLKLVLTGNHKPTVKGTDNGIWRRMRLVPFRANFMGREDVYLLERLREEMPHILAWAVEGCLQWQARGLRDVPTCITDATSEYRDEMDVLGQWLEDQCEQGGATESNLLYADYKAWAERNGLRAVWAAKVFGKKLAEYSRRGWSIGSDRNKFSRLRTGVTLRNPIFIQHVSK
jgi:P4 family phage/plasmid primase-like protien